MSQRIETIKKLRLFLLSHIEPLTATQFNTIPQKYHNNIIWNVAHLIASQQTICYFRAGKPFLIDDKFVSAYLPGTRPEGFVQEEQIHFIKEQLISTIDRFKEDYKENIFANYSPSERIKQVYDIKVTNIEEAIDFLLYHEGYHIGSILSLKHHL